MTDRSPFVVVANRLPVDEVPADVPAGRTSGDNRRRWRRSPGGLVTALHPVLVERSGTWIGWAGTPGDAPEPFELDGIKLRPIELSEDDLDRYYEGQSNATIWPLYHDNVEPPIFRRRWREAYRAKHRTRPIPR